MHRIFKILIIDKNREAVTAYFVKKQQITQNTTNALLQLGKFYKNLYYKCNFCNNSIDIMLVMVYNDF